METKIVDQHKKIFLYKYDVSEQYDTDLDLLPKYVRSEFCQPFIPINRQIYHTHDLKNFVLVMNISEEYSMDTFRPGLENSGWEEIPNIENDVLKEYYNYKFLMKTFSFVKVIPKIK